jgi:hypothetical protein
MRRLILSLGLAVSLSALYASPALARRGHHHAGTSAGEGAQKAPLFPTSGTSRSRAGAIRTILRRARW